jgi:predicted PurR-regulated permease PerM
MISNKIDYKLVNIAIIAIIVLIVHQTIGLWMGVINTIIRVVFPFLIAFAIAYALYPSVVFFTNKKIGKFTIKKNIAVLIVIFITVAVIALIFGLALPLLFGQITSLFDSIIKFVDEIGNKYDFNVVILETTLKDTFNNIVSTMSQHISDGAISFVNTSISFLGNVLITFAASIYFLIDFEKIKDVLKKIILHRSEKLYNYLSILNKDLRNYLNGLLKVMIVSYFEYTIGLLIIGHPNALLIGFIAIFANIIPYFGGIANNTLALITAFVVSPAMFFKTAIVSSILSSADSFIINPNIYGKSNSIHPLIIIFAVFAGGLLLGTFGVIISLPVAIALIGAYKFYEQELKEKLNKKERA